MLLGMRVARQARASGEAMATQDGRGQGWNSSAGRPRASSRNTIVRRSERVGRRCFGCCFFVPNARGQACCGRKDRTSGDGLVFKLPVSRLSSSALNRAHASLLAPGAARFGMLYSLRVLHFHRVSGRRTVDCMGMLHHASTA